MLFTVRRLSHYSLLIIDVNCLAQGRVKFCWPTTWNDAGFTWRLFMFPGLPEYPFLVVGNPTTRGSERNRKTTAPGRPRGSFGHLLPVVRRHIGGRWCAKPHELCPSHRVWDVWSPVCLVVSAGFMFVWKLSKWWSKCTNIHNRRAQSDSHLVIRPWGPGGGACAPSRKRHHTPRFPASSSSRNGGWPLSSSRGRTHAPCEMVRRTTAIPGTIKNLINLLPQLPEFRTRPLYLSFALPPLSLLYSLDFNKTRQEIGIVLYMFPRLESFRLI